MAPRDDLPLQPTPLIGREQELAAIGNRLAAGPDGTLDRFPIPTMGGVPYHIVTGPDGALWFTEMAGNKIGRAHLRS